MYENKDQQEFLERLNEEFNTAHQKLKIDWDKFMSYFNSSKQYWTDEQFFYFEKRVLEIDQSVENMSKKIQGPILQFLDDKIKYLDQHRK